MAEAARNMVEHFGDLSDSFVLLAESARAQKDTDRSFDAFNKALDRGIPIFADGLARLNNGIERFSSSDRRTLLIRRVFAKRVRGLLWSAWTPQDFVPGEPLE